MSELAERCLDAFPQWLKSLADDVSALTALVGRDDVPTAARRQLAGAVNYLFKSLDLIPDGIEDLGFVDDAFILRAAASIVAGDVRIESEEAATLARLSADAELVREFLGETYPRLKRYTEELTTVNARGRSVDAIVAEPATFSALASDVKGWVGAYSPPSFSRDEKNLIKVKSFLNAKLPE